MLAEKSLCGIRIGHTSTNTPLNDAAWMKKFVDGPTSAIRIPPIAGPMIRVIWNAALFSAIAFIMSTRSTEFATSACRIGLFIAQPAPNMNVNTNRCSTRRYGDDTSSANTSPSSARYACVTISSFRRSIRSDSTPLIGPAIRNGIPRTPATVPVNSASPVRSYASHPIVTCCTQFPALATSVLAHSKR